MKEKIIHAAGGIVIRSKQNISEIALIHRPKYDDWSYSYANGLLSFKNLSLLNHMSMGSLCNILNQVIKWRGVID